MKITQKHIPINTKRRSGLKLLGVKFIVAHDTGNDSSTALSNVNYYITSANEKEASAHAFVDDLGVIECLPLDEKAYHVRRVVSNAIDYAFGIELCYGSKWGDRNLTAYKNYVEYISGLCRKHNLNPKKDIVGHYKLDPTRRTDPLNAFKYLDKTWEHFIQDVTDFKKTDEKINGAVPPKGLDPSLFEKLVALIKSWRI